MNGREEVRSSDSQEAEAIREAQRGDANAFELLYRLHSAGVFALCLRMLKNTAEAEDLTQEAFLTVFRALRKFRGHSAFSSWLHRVTMNCVLMHIRRKALAQTSLEEIIRSGEESGSPRKELRHFDLRLKGLIDRLSIQKAIARLPHAQREPSDCMTSMVANTERLRKSSLARRGLPSLNCAGGSPPPRRATAKTPAERHSA